MSFLGIFSIQYQELDAIKNSSQALREVRVGSKGCYLYNSRPEAFEGIRQGLKMGLCALLVLNNFRSRTYMDC